MKPRRDAMTRSAPNNERDGDAGQEASAIDEISTAASDRAVRRFAIQRAGRTRSGRRRADKKPPRVRAPNWFSTQHRPAGPAPQGRRPSGHDQPKRPVTMPKRSVTMRRSARSRSTGTCGHDAEIAGHDGPKYPFAGRRRCIRSRGPIRQRHSDATPDGKRIEEMWSWIPVTRSRSRTSEVTGEF
jgi:hypothetical protein